MIVFGITGNLGSGKSSLAIDLQSYWATQNKQLNIVELDDIRRYALWKSTENHHIQLRKDLSKALKISSDSNLYWLDRKEFTELIFSDRKILDIYVDIATQVLMYDIKKIINLEKLDTVIVWAHLLEENYDKLLTGSVIITDCSSTIILNRLIPGMLKGNDLSYQELQKRMDLQSNTKKYLSLAKEKNIHCILQNTEENLQDEQLKKLFTAIYNNKVINNE